MEKKNLKRLRKDPNFRSRENKINLKTALSKTQTYKEIERETNKLRITIKRQDHNYKTKEKASNLQRIFMKRKNQLFTEEERKKNLQRIKKLREEILYTETERRKNLFRMKEIRKDKIKQIKEKLENRERMRVLRKLSVDLNYITKEKISDKERKRLLRIDDFHRYNENYSNMIRKRIKSGIKDNEYFQNILIMNFIEKRKLGPEIVCVCCENLFFLKSVERFNITKIRKKIILIKKNGINDFLNQIVNNSSEYVCKTCKKQITLGNLPKTASNAELRFSNVPKIVSNLTTLEERMVSPYIPFMQIKALQPYAINPQLSLKGSIVNLPVEINEMINVLPRTFDVYNTN